MSNHYRHFKHLHIPDGWEQYWSKYPNGYTLMEALINWVGQVNDMVEVSNEVSDQITCLQRNFNALDKELRASWAGYKESTTKQYEDFRDEVHTIINNWIASIEPTIQNKVVQSLQLWLSDGTLADIINNDVFDMKANQTDLVLLGEEVDLKANQTDVELLSTTVEGVNTDLQDTKAKVATDLNTPPRHSGITYSKHFDTVSNTAYTITRIPMTDAITGVKKELKFETSIATPKTIDVLAKEYGATFAINAGVYVEEYPEFEKLDFLSMKDGVVLNDKPSPRPTRHTLGILADGTLKSYINGTQITTLQADGVLHAITDFAVIIENSLPVSASFTAGSASSEPHPRQVLCQMPNGDLLTMSTGGRGAQGAGMSMERCSQILLPLGVKFAYMLDGGGSVQTVVRGVNVAPNSNDRDGYVGHEHRARYGFLYIKDNPNTPKDKTTKELSEDINSVANSLEKFTGADSILFTPKLMLNALDSPGIIYKTQEGMATRIGNLVIATFVLEVTDMGSDVGTIRLAGLPFTHDINTPQVFAPIGKMEGFNKPHNGIFGSIWNANYLVMRYIDPTTFKYKNMSSADLETTANIAGQIIYKIKV